MKEPQPIDQVEAFEAFLREGPDPNQHYVLRLYVTGSTPRSTRAIQNIRALCEEHLHGRYDLQVIDIRQQPGNAKAPVRFRRSEVEGLFQPAVEVQA